MAFDMLPYLDPIEEAEWDYDKPSSSSTLTPASRARVNEELAFNHYSSNPDITPLDTIDE